MPMPPPAIGGKNGTAPVPLPAGACAVPPGGATNRPLDTDGAGAPPVRPGSPLAVPGPAGPVSTWLGSPPVNAGPPPAPPTPPRPPKPPPVTGPERSRRPSGPTDPGPAGSPSPVTGTGSAGTPTLVRAWRRAELRPRLSV